MPRSRPQTLPPRHSQTPGPSRGHGELQGSRDGEGRGRGVQAGSERPLSSQGPAPTSTPASCPLHPPPHSSGPKTDPTPSHPPPQGHQLPQEGGFSSHRQSLKGGGREPQSSRVSPASAHSHPRPPGSGLDGQHRPQVGSGCGGTGSQLPLPIEPPPTSSLRPGGRPGSSAWGHGWGSRTAASSQHPLLPQQSSH